MINREEIARRIAYREGYNIGDIEKVLQAYEDIVVESLTEGHDVKHGNLFKIHLQEVPEKRAYNGLDKVYFTRPAQRVPKLKPLIKIRDIVLPPKGEKKKEGE